MSSRVKVWLFVGLIFIVVISLATAPRNSSKVRLVEQDYPGQVVLGFGCSYDNRTQQQKEVVFAIAPELCGAQPKWDPATQPPPKPLPELEKAAFEFVFGTDSELGKTWKVTNIEFKRFPMSWQPGAPPPEDRVDRWCCLLTLTNQDAEHYAYKTVCVLLDSMCVPPKPKIK